MKKGPFFVVVAGILIAGCASQPILAPNTKYSRVGELAAQKDIEICMARAESHLERTKGRRVAKGAATGAATGAIVGGLLNSRNFMRGAVAGGIVGGAAGAIGGSQSPEGAKRYLVNRCLAEKGYEVAGWD